jgi:hypothetical protein
MGLFKDINYNINLQEEEYNETIRIEKAKAELCIKRQKKQREKLEKQTRGEYWYNVKDEIYSRYQLPIADDAKKVAKDLFGKDVDMVSVFFLTDERIVKQRYIEGGDKGIDLYANNLIRHAFIGGPITATLLRRLKLLEDAKKDGNVIDTEVDIDGFPPHGKMLYAINEVELDEQIIPARRKFSIRCEMTATITEGFRTGPFVSYDELYISNKDEVEQIIDEDVKKDQKNKLGHKDDFITYELKKHGKTDKKIKVCSHGTDKTLYCNLCHGDILVSQSIKIIGICLDTSGSMGGSKLSNAKTAVINILERIPVNSNVQVVLLIFDSDLEMNHDYIIPFGIKYTESTRSSAISIVKNIRAGGSTPLYDAINFFLDGIWPRSKCPEEKHFLLDENRIFFPYTHLIMVSDGEENQSFLKDIIYKGMTGKDAFFAKISSYRDAGLITDIIPLAYGDGESNATLVKQLKKISGKKSISEASPQNIVESLTRNVDSILRGEDNLKMIGIPISIKK